MSAGAPIDKSPAGIQSISAGPQVIFSITLEAPTFPVCIRYVLATARAVSSQIKPFGASAKAISLSGCVWGA